MALIPAERLYNWVVGTTVGVEGGIPNRTTIADDADEDGVTDSLVAIDATGATDVATAINAALTAAAAGEVVRLPEGTFKADASIFVPSGKTLRGAGPLATIIKSTANVGLEAGVAGGGYFTPSTPFLKVTDGLTAGSTVLTLTGDASYIVAGMCLKLHFGNLDDPAMFNAYAFDVDTTTSPHNQVVRVVSRVGQTLTISPGLITAHVGEQVRVQTQSFTATALSVEDLTVNVDDAVGSGEGAYASLRVTQCHNGWLRNVHAIKAKFYGIILVDCLYFDVRKCIGGMGKNGVSSNGAGLLGTVYNSLIEDNQFVDAYPVIEINNGASGNVFAYNYGNNTADTNHGPHNRFNLYEGNAFHHQMSDGYFGGESELTAFRNYYWNSSVHLRRGSYNFSMVGNVMASAIGDDGYPNVSNTGYSGTANYTTADWWDDRNMTGRLITRTDDTHGVIEIDAPGTLPYYELRRVYVYWGDPDDLQRAIVVVSSWSAPNATVFVESGNPNLPAEDTEFTVIGPGSGGYQELDLAVAATLIDKGNYDIALASMSSLGGDTLPDSLYTTRAELEARGVDLTGFSWPPFDPQSPEGVSVELIPAGYRFENGEEEPAVATPTHTPGSSSSAEPQNITIACATPDTTIYYTTDGSEPDAADTLYSTPVAISTTTTLKSIAYDGAEYSAVRTSIYTIEEEPEGAITVATLNVGTLTLT